MHVQWPQHPTIKPLTIQLSASQHDNTCAPASIATHVVSFFQIFETTATSLAPVPSLCVWTFTIGRRPRPPDYSRPYRCLSMPQSPGSDASVIRSSPSAPCSATPANTSTHNRTATTWHPIHPPLGSRSRRRAPATAILFNCSSILFTNRSFAA